MQMIAAIELALQVFQAAITAAPQVAELVTKAKEYITALFTAGLITIEQQKVLHDHIDSIAALAKAGLLGSHWDVEGDPNPS